MDTRIGQPGEEFVDEPQELTDEVFEGAEEQEEEELFSIDGKEYSASDLRNYIKGGMLEKDLV